jgi:hypothetical protein
MTVLELLVDNLPDKYIQAVINNMKDKASLHNEATNISAELLSLFDWESSREGYEFWEDVLEAILVSGELPPVPITIEYAPSTMIYSNHQVHLMNVGDTGIHVSFNLPTDAIKHLEGDRKEKVLAFIN